jgi:hypothetical protein
MIRRDNGPRQMHFDCQHGHRFHTNVTMTYDLPCDCKFR